MSIIYTTFKANEFHTVGYKLLDSGLIAVKVTDSRKSDLRYEREEGHHFLTYNDLVDFVTANDHIYVINMLHSQFGARR